MEVQQTKVNTDGEITKATNALAPIWKFIAAFAALAAFMGSVYKTWNKIDSNESMLKELKEQVTRQYNTHNNEIKTLKDDTDNEMDILEEELDAVKEKVIYREGYEQALKDLKK